MRTKNKIFNRGSSLIATLFFLGTATVVLSFFLLEPLQTSQIQKVQKRTNDLKLKAQSGFELAINDITSRAKNQDFDTVANAINLGLVYSNSRSQLSPRFSNTSGNKNLNVYYFPSAGNRDPESILPYNEYYPKEFRVVSEVQDHKTSGYYTVEGTVMVRVENVAEISFGMIDPDLPPGQSVFRFYQSIYSGHVHFGDMEPDKLWFHHDYPWGRPHMFNGEVTFQHKTPAGEEHPFQLHEYGTARFNKGYVDGVNIQLNTNNIFTKAQSESTLNLTSLGLTDICLKYIYDESVSDGKIYRYNCDTTTPFPEQTYIGESAGNSPVEVYDSGHQVYCDNCNIHVKGIYEGQNSIFAKNVVIEGDIIAAHQINSKDTFGALARENLIVPMGVPQYKIFHGYANQSAERAKIEHLENITNFNAPNPINGVANPDRHSDFNQPYFTEFQYETPHVDGHPKKTTQVMIWNRDALGLPNEREAEKNSLVSLELEGSFVAPEGGLILDGIYNYGEFADENDGYAMTDVNGNRWNPHTHNTPTSYYYESGGNWYRRGEPVSCRSWNADGTCPMFDELARASNTQLFIHGGLVTKQFTYMSRDGNSGGFRHRYVIFDERFHDSPPPGFPTASGSVVVEVLWKKEGIGESSYKGLIAQNL